MKACVERVTSDRISGWAFDQDNFDHRVQVALLLDGQLVAEEKAAHFREDLKRNGVGDGHYGYAFTNIHIAQLPDAFLAGRVEVKALGPEKAVAAYPAPNLRPDIERFVHSQAMERAPFAEFLAPLLNLGEQNADSAARWLDLLNASRAHFPEWSQSAAFFSACAALAATANRPLTRLFYHSGPVVTPPETHHAPARLHSFDTYGSLSEWADAGLPVPMAVVRPRFWSGDSSPSFLEEVGILDHSAEPDALPILAYREYAFGEGTWWVQRLGKRTPSARNLYYLDFEQLLSVTSAGGFLLIDMSNEGPAAEGVWLEIFNRALRELRIDPRHVILVTQNLRFGAAGGERFHGRVTTGHYFISKSIQLLREQYPSEADLAKHCSAILSGRAAQSELKHFLCLNFTPRWSRWATVLHLFRRGLLDKGYVSFPGSTNFKLTAALELDKAMPQLLHRDQLLQQVPALIARCPLELDIKASASKSPLYVYPTELATRSLLHLVTESEMTDGTQILRVTEKILKPIVCLQPFIIIGNAGSLALMKSMGFQTFSPLIDENYDAITDPAARMDAILDLIDGLADRSIASLRRSVSELNEVLIHNFIHLMSIGPLLFGVAARNRLSRLMHSCGVSLHADSAQSDHSP